MIKKEVMGFDSATDKNSRFAATATLGKIYIFLQIHSASFHIVWGG